MHRGLVATLLTVFFVLAATSSAFSQEITIGAGAAPTENIFKKIAGPLAKEKGITIHLVSSGPIQAWKDLDAGKVDAASGGMLIQDWQDMMQASGYAFTAGDYTSQIIGMDSIKIFTNKDVSLAVLTKKQVADIFSGEIQNWSELGGNDEPITLVLGTKIPGTMEEFKKKILVDKEYSSTAVMVGTIAEIKQKIVETPGAIGLGAQAQIDATVNVPHYPEVVRVITLLTKNKKDTPAVQEMINFILGDGRKYIK